MNNIKSKYFGEINIDNIKDAYECFLTHENREIFTMLFFEEPFFSDKKITAQDVATGDEIVDKLQNYIDIALETIEQSFQDKEIVYEYIEHHADEFNKIEFDDLGVEPFQKKEEVIKELRKKLFFTSIAIDPTAKEEALSLDFTLSKDLTQYVVVVRMSKDGLVSDIDMES